MSSSYSFSRAHTFSFYRPVDHRDLHSFPTRRSSDLRHRTGRDDHFRAERPQQPRLLLRHLVRHGEDAAIALHGRGEREPYPGISGRRLDDQAAWLEPALVLGRLDHGEPDPVFHRAAWVEELGLGVDRRPD